MPEKWLYVVYRGGIVAKVRWNPEELKAALADVGVDFQVIQSSDWSEVYQLLGRRKKHGGSSYTCSGVRQYDVVHDSGKDE